MFNLILFGPPGSGKGTQSAQIAEKYHLVHLSTGDILRREIRNKSALGLKFQSIIEKGELVPDDLLLEILRSAFRQAGNTRGFVLDGESQRRRNQDHRSRSRWEAGRRRGSQHHNVVG